MAAAKSPRHSPSKAHYVSTMVANPGARGRHQSEFSSWAVAMIAAPTVVERSRGEADGPQAFRHCKQFDVQRPSRRVIVGRGPRSGNWHTARLPRWTVWYLFGSHQAWQFARRRDGETWHLSRLPSACPIGCGSHLRDAAGGQESLWVVGRHRAPGTGYSRFVH